MPYQTMPLRLDDLRGALIRQEETIIFALLERAQFKLNAPIYEAGAIPIPGFAGCFSDYLLYETEKVHARVRRYTSPDETPFFADLPAPVLPAMDFPPWLKPNAINVNPRVMEIYRTLILPRICQEGDCQNYGSSAVCDVACLQAISKRVHYGKFVAEAKYQADRGTYETLIRRRDADALMAQLTDPAVEARVVRRVARKAAAYGQDPELATQSCKIDPDAAACIYRDWIMPLTKQVQVLYLLERLDD